MLNGASANSDDGARLDITANGFLGGDVRVINPHAPINKQHSLSSTYKKHERIEIRAYEQCVHEIEHGSFTPPSQEARAMLPMFSSRGLLQFQSYSLTLTWMRCKLSYTFHPMQLAVSPGVLCHQRASCCLSLVFPNLVLCYCLFSVVSLLFVLYYYLF